MSELNTITLRNIENKHLLIIFMIFVFIILMNDSPSFWREVNYLKIWSPEKNKKGLVGFFQVHGMLCFVQFLDKSYSWLNKLDSHDFIIYNVYWTPLSPITMTLSLKKIWVILALFSTLIILFIVVTRSQSHKKINMILQKFRILQIKWI